MISPRLSAPSQRSTRLAVATMASMMTWTGWVVGMTSTCSSRYSILLHSFNPHSFFYDLYSFFLSSYYMIAAAAARASLPGLISWSTLFLPVWVANCFHHARLHYIFYTTTYFVAHAASFFPPVPRKQHEHQLYDNTVVIFVTPTTFFHYFIITCLCLLLFPIGCVIDDNRLYTTTNSVFIWHDIFTARRSEGPPGRTRGDVRTYKYLTLTGVFFPLFLA